MSTLNFTFAGPLECKDLHDLIRFIEPKAREIFLSKEELIPMFFAASPVGTLIVPMPWRDRAEKWSMLRTGLMAAKSIKAPMCGFVSEIWQSVVAKDVDLDTVPLPSEDPNRQEAVMIVATDFVLATSLTVYIPIIRSGEAATLGETEKFTEGTGFGPFAELMPQQGRSN